MATVYGMYVASYIQSSFQNIVLPPFVSAHADDTVDVNSDGSTDVTTYTYNNLLYVRRDWPAIVAQAPLYADDGCATVASGNSPTGAGASLPVDGDVIDGEPLEEEHPWYACVCHTVPEEADDEMGPASIGAIAALSFVSLSVGLWIGLPEFRSGQLLRWRGRWRRQRESAAERRLDAKSVALPLLSVQLTAKVHARVELSVTD